MDPPEKPQAFLFSPSASSISPPYTSAPVSRSTSGNTSPYSLSPPSTPVTPIQPSSSYGQISSLFHNGHQLSLEKGKKSHSYTSTPSLNRPTSAPGSRLCRNIKLNPLYNPNASSSSELHSRPNTLRRNMSASLQSLHPTTSSRRRRLDTLSEPVSPMASSPSGILHHQEPSRKDRIAALLKAAAAKTFIGLSRSAGNLFYPEFIEFGTRYNDVVPENIRAQFLIQPRIVVISANGPMKEFGHALIAVGEGSDSIYIHINGLNDNPEFMTQQQMQSYLGNGKRQILFVLSLEKLPLRSGRSLNLEAFSQSLTRKATRPFKWMGPVENCASFCIDLAKNANIDMKSIRKNHFISMTQSQQAIYPHVALKTCTNADSPKNLIQSPKNALMYWHFSPDSLWDEIKGEYVSNPIDNETYRESALEARMTVEEWLENNAESQEEISQTHGHWSENLIFNPAEPPPEEMDTTD